MRIAIIGAGPSGISAAYQLAKGGAEVEVFEAGDVVGGLSRSVDLWGQRVDLGPHRFFSSDQRVNQLWFEVVGDDYRMVDRLTRIYYNKRFFHYPLRAGNALWNMGSREAMRCTTSYLMQQLARSPHGEDDESFESWVVHRFGRRLFELFFKSYSEKLWGIDCRNLDADFATQRIKKFSLGEAIKSALGLGNGGHKTLVDCFAYPAAGTGMVYQRMADAVVAMGGQVHLRAPVKRVVHRNRHVHGVQLHDGSSRACDHVISTMPLTLLVEGLDVLPAEVQTAVDSLTYRNTILVYLHVGAEELFSDQWLYVHSPDLQVGRITNFRNWVPELYGDARTSILSLEYWCSDHDLLWSAPSKDLIALATREIRSTGLIRDLPVLDGRVLRCHRSYPVYRCGYKEHLARVISFLDTYRGLTAIGRYGAFKYNNQDHSILMGILAAEQILEGREHQLWQINTDYENYQEAAEVAQPRRAA
jgi:protoporphyrinogen oxidase